MQAAQSDYRREQHVCNEHEVADGVAGHVALDQRLFVPRRVVTGGGACAVVAENEIDEGKLPRGGYGKP